MQIINGFKKSKIYHISRHYQYTPVPFCIAHVNFIRKNKTMSKRMLSMKFNKYRNMPRSSYKLYWKLHPEERFWLFPEVF